MGKTIDKIIAVCAGVVIGGVGQYLISTKDIRLKDATTRQLLEQAEINLYQKKPTENILRKLDYIKDNLNHEEENETYKYKKHSH